jgi:hypothetical protein
LSFEQFARASRVLICFFDVPYRDDDARIRSVIRLFSYAVHRHLCVQDLNLATAKPLVHSLLNLCRIGGHKKLEFHALVLSANSSSDPSPLSASRCRRCKSIFWLAVVVDMNGYGCEYDSEEEAQIGIERDMRQFVCNRVETVEKRREDTPSHGYEGNKAYGELGPFSKCQGLLWWWNHSVKLPVVNKLSGRAKGFGFINWDKKIFALEGMTLTSMRVVSFRRSIT